VTTPSRTLTTLAIGVLLLDAALLAYAGVLLDKRSLVLWGGSCAALAVFVALGWRWYRRALTEIDAARREVRGVVQSIRDLLHRHHLNS
jgi:hypothetical protein